jgi:hypothetical protein
MEVLLEMGYFYVVMPRNYLEDNWGDKVSSLRECVKRRLESRRISTVRSRCQEMTGEDISGYKRLSGCCGDL